MDITDIVICSCHSDEHQIIFKYDTDPKWKQVYVSYHLTSKTFWERLKTAIKHIFGKKSKYGDWGELVLNPDEETIRKFEGVIKKLKEVREHEIQRDKTS